MVAANECYARVDTAYFSGIAREENDLKLFQNSKNAGEQPNEAESDWGTHDFSNERRILHSLASLHSVSYRALAGARVSAFPYSILPRRGRDVLRSGHRHPADRF